MKYSYVQVKSPVSILLLRITSTFSFLCHGKSAHLLSRHPVSLSHKTSEKKCAPFSLSCLCAKKNCSRTVQSDSYQREFIIARTFRIVNVSRAIFLRFYRIFICGFLRNLFLFVPSRPLDMPHSNELLFHRLPHSFAVFQRSQSPENPVLAEWKLPLPYSHL